MLIIKKNPLHPETGSLFLKYRDGEEGFIRMIPASEMREIEEGKREIRREG